MAIFNSILMLLAGCGVFMAGMKMMGDGLEQSAGPGLKKLFGKISSNRFAGIGVGTAVTGIIQSSAATTVMAIGFVNAGVMTLMQATAIVMGANIGTTVTGILISFSAFDVGLYASVLAFIGVMMMFFTNDKVKKIGSILCGLGVLFVGLDVMSGSFKNSPITDVFAKIFTAIDFPLLLILVGMVFTALIQSSSAATGLIIIMVGSGALRVESALFIVLGTNIGTCVTALLASIGTSTNARRVAIVHLIFNLIGTAIFTVILWIFATPIANLLAKLFPTREIQIAMFHVCFNVITTGVLVGFIPQLVKLAQLIIKDKPSKEEEEIHQLHYIDDRLLQTPAIAVAQVQKEIMHMASLARENFVTGVTSLTTANAQVDDELFRKNEAKINYTYHAVARYLIKLSSSKISENDEKLVGAYHHVISNIERVGDYSENFIEQARKMSGESIDFSPEAMDELKGMADKVLDMFDKSMHAFDALDYTILGEISAIEDQVDDLKDELGAAHIRRLNAGDCIVERGTYFFAVISALERIADHMLNVAYSIKNPTGSQSSRSEMNEVLH